MTEKSGNVKASDISSALARMHGNDFFITECKNGSTWFMPQQGGLRFDALVINKSWVNNKIRIYEIKVSRSDFKQDAKLHLYKQYCNELVLVCPKGLIQKEEIADDMGLFWYYPESRAIRTIKKPLWMDNAPDPDVLLYIIKCRLQSERIPFFSSKREYAEAYIQNKAEEKEIGYKLGTRMAQELADAKREIKRLKDAGNTDKKAILDRVISIIRSHGSYCFSHEEIPAALDRALSIGAGGPEFERLERSAENLLKVIRDIREKANQSADNTAPLEGEE